MTKAVVSKKGKGNLSERFTDKTTIKKKSKAKSVTIEEQHNEVLEIPKASVKKETKIEPYLISEVWNAITTEKEQYDIQISKNDFNGLNINITNVEGSIVKNEFYGKVINSNVNELKSPFAGSSISRDYEPTDKQQMCVVISKDGLNSFHENYKETNAKLNMGYMITCVAIREAIIDAILFILYNDPKRDKTDPVKTKLQQTLQGILNYYSYLIFGI